MGARREEVAPRRLDGLDLSEIDWLIAGGESGRGHRPCRAEWLRDLRDASKHGKPAVVALTRREVCALGNDLRPSDRDKPHPRPRTATGAVPSVPRFRNARERGL
jgi:Protein of unknown function (DUF5131)